VAAKLIDPAWLVAATLHADNGAGMTGKRVRAFAPPKHASDLETEPGVPSVEHEEMTID
jgi:hypothetical protein